MPNLQSENERRAAAVANEAANEMARQLEHATPAELGWPDMTAEGLIESERKAWYAEELHELRSAAR